MGVDINNLAEINTQVNSQLLTTAADIQTLTGSVNIIQSYAVDNTHPSPSVTDYVVMGVIGVDVNNVDDVNGQVGSQSLITLADIQTLTDSVNVIQSYAADNKQPAPSVTNYAVVGLTSVDASNLAEMNYQLDNQSLASIASIQALIDSFVIIETYALDKTAKEPALIDYRNIGGLSVNISNIDFINEAIGGSNSSTNDDFFAIIADVVFELSRTGIDISPDLDGDGILNGWDEDIDGDNILNANDPNPLDPLQTFDIDGDGTEDNTSDFDVIAIEFTEDSAVEVVGGQIYQFMPLTLANGAQITNAAVFSGNINIVDNTLVYKASEPFPQQVYIEYEVISPSGDITKELLLLVNQEMTPEGAPIFFNVEPITIPATALFTPIIGLSPTATDILGNRLPVSLASNQPRLRSGNNVVYWQSDDSNSGKSQLAAQLFKIQPLINFGQGKDIFEGHQAIVRVHLSGFAPDYPVTVPVLVDEVSSTADFNDHSLPEVQNVVITSGLEGLLVFDVTPDEFMENEERLTLKISREVNTGPQSELTLNIQESDPPPRVTAHVINEAGDPINIVSLFNLEPLYLRISVDNEDIPMQLVWSYLSDTEEKILLGETGHTEQLLINIPMEIGRYRFFVEASALDYGFSIDASVDLRVIEPITLTIDKDSDYDGIPDLAEGFSDSDGDLIPDYLDAVDSCELQVIDNERVQNGGFVLQSSPGNCIKLGRISEISDTYSPYVNASNALSVSSVPEDVVHKDKFNESEISNFIVTNIQNESATIVLPLMQPFSRGGIFRKHTKLRGWFDFDSSEEGSSLRYALGELGFCPSPGSALYQSEPLIGANCLELTIKDGGIHDGDGERNGVIDDPGYIVYKQAALILDKLPLHFQYDLTSNKEFYELSFDLCDYIELVHCNITVLSAEFANVIEATVEGTRIHLKMPGGERTYDGRVVFDREGQLSTQEINVIVTSSAIGEISVTKGASGGVVSGILLFFLALILLWRSKKMNDVFRSKTPR
ncbi:hypothetical protein [Aliivibrio finisterrensis]|uniref:hypothetical protein n=1 Tax=Aliivibrio finisterrensis TaxID=511998 RepID=UPI001AD79961|nr:hypothetical protein [Aliivibrio finisterrensis]